MCKIMTISGIKNNEKLESFVLNAQKAISTVEKDGFGYAAIDSEEKLFGECWLNTRDAFKKRDSDIAAKNILQSLQNTLDIPQNYSHYGNIPKNIFSTAKAIILHGRTSTNTVSIENTHPFFENDIALIHNGVISNHNDFKKRQSSCDSESILIKYQKESAHKNPKNIQNIVDSLTGYFAFAVFAKTQNNYFLDIVKCDRANLFCAVIAELGNAIVYSTCDRILRDACRKTGFKIPVIAVVKSWIHTRLDCKTNQVIVNAQLIAPKRTNIIDSKSWLNSRHEYQPWNIDESEYRKDESEINEDDDYDDINDAILEEYYRRQKKF